MMKYKNPVIPGFYPDPSACRVGEDYYLVTSSFEYFPGVPLFHSRDLINWRQIGYCLKRKSQLLLENVKSSGGIYAPTIRYHDGTFYMITTNVNQGGNFYVYTKDPLGEWSDPVFVNQGGIDPSLFFDDDGNVYLSSTGEGAIVQSRIDIKTGERLTDVKQIWTGTGGSYPEGPHLYKIHNMYYLMIAEGGTGYGHMETIARSNNPWGPFEGYPRNPILTHRSTIRPIQATGHADLIEAHNGTWWMVFLGIRPVGFPHCHNLGRETFLAPVKWLDSGWPVVGQDGKVFLEMKADCLPQHPWEKGKCRDDFDNEGLGLQWNFLRNPRNEEWSLSERPGWLRLIGSENSLNDTNPMAFVGQRQRHFQCSISALLDFAPRYDGEEAGLAVRMSESHHYEIAVTSLGNERHIIVRCKIGSFVEIRAREKVETGPVRLKVKATPEEYFFSYALENKDFKIIGKAETRYLSSEVAGGFTGVYFAMYATGGGKKSTTPAFFDWFEYIEEDK